MLSWTPLFVYHGIKDRVVPVWTLLEFLMLFTSYFSPLHPINWSGLAEFHLEWNMGHKVTEEEKKKLAKFLNEHVK